MVSLSLSLSDVGSGFHCGFGVLTEACEAACRHRGGMLLFSEYLMYGICGCGIRSRVDREDRMYGVLWGTF